MEKPASVADGGLEELGVMLQRHTGVSKVEASRKTLERSARDGDSPVGESIDPPASLLSTTGHEKPCGKLGRPRPKAKYS